MNRHSGTASHTARLIRAPATSVYDAFTKPDALEAWLVPSGTTGTIHGFAPGVGGGYKMALTWMEPGSDRGEGFEQEDHYTATFVELVPDRRVVMVIRYENPDHKWSGDITMIVTMEREDSGTRVTIDFENLPDTITPADNDAGTRSALEKLARYLE